MVRRNPSKTSSPGSRNEQSLEANADHQRRACPQFPCPQSSRTLPSLNGAHEAPAAEPAVKWHPALSYSPGSLLLHRSHGWSLRHS